MKRRAFIRLLGGAAAWPLAARAQQAMPTIGALFLGSREQYTSMLAGFYRSLREAGYIDGQSVRIDYRFAEGRRDRLPGLAAELVRRRVNVIVAGASTAEHAKAATTAIPIVFMNGSDPVRLGLVASLNRPGGNLTGVTMIQPDLMGKRLGLLRELLPKADRVAALLDPGGPAYAFQLQEIENLGRSAGLTIRIMKIGNEREFDDAFATLAREQTDAIIVHPSALFVGLRDRLVSLAARHRIPTMYELREFAEAGGLVSYGPSVSDAYRLVGVYTGRVLKGEKPADLPVQLPIKFDLVINLSAAKALALDIPPMLLARADEVIE